MKTRREAPGENGARRHRSFRLAPSTIERLERRAREGGESRSRLVERYIDEGLRTEEHPLIIFREGPAGRRPALAGTRLDVWQVVDTLRSAGNSFEEAARYLGISEAQVQACVRYYAAYRQEIDAWRARHEEIARREEEQWRREREILA